MSELKKIRVPQTQTMETFIKLTDEFDLKATEDLIKEKKIKYPLTQVPFRYRFFGTKIFYCVGPLPWEEALSITIWISNRAEKARQKSRKPKKK